ncbi:MAG: DUF935 family protein [Verrucomicrobia bacterium]|nr:DUF935 family protein [Verrucomicrobiota bacterium]
MIPDNFDKSPGAAENSTRELASVVPMTTMTVVNSLYEPPALAHRMDAHKLQSILRAAEGGSVGDLFALFRDVVLTDGYIQTLISTRKLAVLGDAMSVLPPDKNNEEDQFVAAAIREMVENYDAPQPTAAEFENMTPWLNALAAMMDGHVGPVSVTEKVWKPSTRRGLRFELRALVPVPYHLLDYTTGRLMILDTDKNGAPLGTRHEANPNQYIVHRGHLLSTPDNWGGPMRSLLFWNLFLAMGRDWWARFLDRYALPIPVGKFDQTDDDARRILQRAFQMFVRIGGLVVSKETEVELMQASTAAGDAFKQFRDTGKKEIAQIILGQTASSDAQSGGGMNSGIGQAQESVRQDIRAWDKLALARTLKQQLFAQFVRINGLRGRVSKAVFGSVSPAEQKAIGELLKNMHEAGLEPADEALAGLSETFGMQVRRVAAPPYGNPLLGALSAFNAEIPAHVSEGETASNEIARSASAELARAFRGSLAPIRQLILESKSPKELERSIRLFFADLPPARQSSLIEEALVAYGANGAAAGARI